MAEASALLSGWLRDHPDVFQPTDAISTVVPWWTYRIDHTLVPGGTIVDLGGGLALTNAALVELGMDAYVVDMLDDYFVHSTTHDTGEREQQFLADRGVQFIKADLVDCDLRDHFPEQSVDVVASFHALEHFHHSPRRLLESALAVLKPGGRVFIEVPNAVNLLKRVDVARGRTNYLPFSQFWTEDVWVGHVREYTVGDLRELASRLGLAEVSITGRNWYGTLYRKLPRPVAAVVDRGLRTRPGWCGSLFLSGVKP